MKLIPFPEQTVTVAEKQPKYNPMPAYRYQNDPDGRIVCCWKMSWGERFKAFLTGKLWHHILTFNDRVKPTLLSTEKPEMPKHERQPVRGAFPKQALERWLLPCDMCPLPIGMNGHADTYEIDGELYIASLRCEACDLLLGKQS